MLATKRAGSSGVLQGWHSGMTDAVVGSSEAVNGSSEAPCTLPFLSKALVGVGASVPFGCLRGITFALWSVCTASFGTGWALSVAGAAPGVVKPLPRVSSAVTWCNKCSPSPFADVAGPAPFVVGAVPSGMFVPPAA